MDCQIRNRRLRLLISKLNKERKTQANKLDILCNDIILAQKDFIDKFDTVSFAAQFYKSILGKNNLNSLLYEASKLIKDEIGDANISFFLSGHGNFQMHIFESSLGGISESHNLEDCFTAELVGEVCESNKLCTLADLLSIGLQCNPSMLNDITGFTIPLGEISKALGFVLIYRSIKNQLDYKRLSGIFAIVPGLSRAIELCKPKVQTTD
ncbi:MAG: hypothetical protein JXB29_01960 [Sedimentisphaerales bacterium]|nr:hypothetical protein [Sedimentisphaerales bacterium]